MKILRSIRSVNPEHGGPIEGIKQVSKVHEAEGHRVEIISLDSPADPWVKECPVNTHALGPAAGKFGYSRSFIPWIKKHAAEYDAVIINGIWQYNSLGAWLGVGRSRTPYYVFPHGMLDPWFKRAHPLKHLKKWMYWPWAEYRVLRDARAVCFTCEEERRMARKSFWLYRCREQVVSYGTAAPGGDARRQRELFLERYPRLREKRIILFLGRIHHKKGCDLLVRAFHKLVSTRPGPAGGDDVRLVMAGPDESGWARELRVLAQSCDVADKIEWPGMLTGDLKLGAFRAADVFALPSHQENFGIAVVEALACGVPVLISDKVNIWREIAEDGAGLVEPDTETGAYFLLQRWYSLKPEEQRRHREQAERCFAARFQKCAGRRGA